MNLTYAITVCNEIEEIKRLVPFLIENKDNNDKIIILYDEINGNEEVINFLLPYNILPNVQTWRGFDFKNDFAKWKNKLNSYCETDYIFQLDADEMITKILIRNIKSILSLNPNVDLFYLSRVNIVDGITDNDIINWGWKKNEKGWLNWPDKQGRIFKKGMVWDGKVHERIVTANIISYLPEEEQFSIQHIKTIERQKKQNSFYSSLQKK
jgi:hypothetical protein